MIQKKTENRSLTEKIRPYFGDWGMPWRRVLLLAGITAVWTALVCVIPFLKETSFHDIAVNLECWILFAVLIVVNCKKGWEAALKCFVFFLVSQPLIYLLQVPFSSQHWQIFSYYRYWFVITLLTLPGGAIAFLVKKKNWLSAAVLTVATGFLGIMAVEYVRSVIVNFPFHLLSALFCLGLMILFPILLLNRKAHRLAVLLLSAAILIGYAALTMPEYTKEFELGPGDWSVELSDDSVVSVEIEGSRAVIRTKHLGSALLTFTEAGGEVRLCDATVSSGGIWLSVRVE